EKSDGAHRGAIAPVQGGIAQLRSLSGRAGNSCWTKTASRGAARVLRIGASLREDVSNGEKWIGAPAEAAQKESPDKAKQQRSGLGSGLLVVETRHAASEFGRDMSRPRGSG